MDDMSENERKKCVECAEEWCENHGYSFIGIDNILKGGRVDIQAHNGKRNEKGELITYSLTIKTDHSMPIRTAVLEAIEGAIREYNDLHGTEYSLEWADFDAEDLTDCIRDGEDNIVMTIGHPEGR